MHTALTALHDQITLHTPLLANALDGLDPAQAERHPEDGTNSLTFIALHMADARFYLAGQLGSELESPFTALVGINDISAVKEPLPPLEEILGHWRRAGEELGRLFAELDESKLAVEAPARFPVRDGSLLGMLAFLVHHEAFHLGQIALLRRQQGHPAMSYARPEA